jgi:arsenite methyltransferase
MTQQLDQWAEWILYRRHGGDQERLQQVLEYLYPIRDTVLDNAALQPGNAVLDVGCGDGLIGFGALERIGQNGKLIFSDISVDLLELCRTHSVERGVIDQCDFRLAPADNLHAVEDQSVDAVTVRSVLIYVEDKLSAFKEFYRVLKPGGRLSLFEPVNSFGYDGALHKFFGFDVTPVLHIARLVRAIYERIQPPDYDPMLNFTERDLIVMAEHIGFDTIQLEFQASIQPTPMMKWETYINTAGNPRIPTLKEAMEKALMPEEIPVFEGYLRPLVEEGKGTMKSAVAYIKATKPA